MFGLGPEWKAACVDCGLVQDDHGEAGHEFVAVRYNGVNYPDESSYLMAWLGDQKPPKGVNLLDPEAVEAFLNGDTEGQ